MMVQILIAQRQPIHSLCNQLGHGMFNTVCRPVIGESRRKPRHDTGTPGDLAQQQPSSIGSDLAAVESGDEFTEK
jgi:hypothetical protein